MNDEICRNTVLWFELNESCILMGSRWKGNINEKKKLVKDYMPEEARQVIEKLEWKYRALLRK